MSEENENQPPLESQAAAPGPEGSERPREDSANDRDNGGERRRRPRRRFPRRRGSYSEQRPAGDGSSAASAQNAGDGNGDYRPSGNQAVASSEGGEGEERREQRGDREGDFDQPADMASQNGEQIDREPEFGEGVIEISGKGFGFLRDAKRNFVQTPQDIFVTPEIVRRFSLRDGMWIHGETRRGNRGPQLMKLLKINDDEPTKYQGLRPFEELTTINPNKRIKLETVPDRYTTRIMDLMTPLGMGQRGIIVAPPRTGKTTLLHHIADAVVKNHADMKLIILLVDERPEEVTDFRRSCPKAEVMASSNDSDIKSHTRIAQLAIERAKRLVEAGKHVFILLDSITRTARAFNNATGGGGRTMSGGIDARAMEIPRKIFAAARNTEEAGSLTIVATALIETGSRMDELIFQEFKGTGNMELVLDRKISDQRIYPAVDIFLSGTRREELLLQPWELDKINMIRRGLAGHKPEEAIQRLLMFVKKFPTNFQMLKEIPG
jgi:transcription termination factor Rho